mgnify:CR=1 FL=1
MQKRPWIALLGWLPPIYVWGLFAHRNKPWGHSDFLFDLGGNTPIFWWPTRLYRHHQRLT